jgi:hypothetical protein
MTSPDHPRAPFDEKVARQLRAGDLGRAKQILKSRLQQTGFDPDALEQIGWILLQMRDPFEAGRYLFLAGRDLPSYRPAIETFLARTRRLGLREFTSLWPAQLRRTKLADLPPAVREELRSRGMRETEFDGTLDDVRRRAMSTPKSERVFMGLLVLLVVTALIALLLLLRACD